jgi:hypothetical protein
MKDYESTSMLRTDLALAALVVAFAAAAFIFRDGLGLLIFAALGLAALVQLFRVAFMRGRKETLKELWKAFKDAFWGIG